MTCLQRAASLRIFSQTACALFAILAFALPQTAGGAWVFRMPSVRTFQQILAPTGTPQLQEVAEPEWMAVRLDESPEEVWYLGRRIVIELASGTSLDRLPGLPKSDVARGLRPGLFVLEAADPESAAALAEEWGRLPGVVAAHPVYRRSGTLEFAIAPSPNDGFFEPLVSNVAGQWYLEHRNPTNGQRLGIDLNARSAWALGRGKGVTIAIGDVGVELTHRDLVDRVAGAPHYDFLNNTNSGKPVWRQGQVGAHGTACAGLAAATADNDLAMSGIAPEAGIASWVVMDRRTVLVSDEKLAEMFAFATNQVGVQNHSWGVPTKRHDGPGLLEDAALEFAFRYARTNRGVVMVRAAGNHRAQGQNSNDDGYANDWRAICVAAVRKDGRA
ncbi:MAG: hypothetical protein FJ405_14510, partial [Verrucomicrobia bacterium]|nr:hypothetical protein [Verrucomicrobiota bacterium]